MYEIACGLKVASCRFESRGDSDVAVYAAGYNRIEEREQ